MHIMHSEMPESDAEVLADRPKVAYVLGGGGDVSLLDPANGDLAPLQTVPVGGTEAEFGDGIRTDVAHWAKVIKDADIKLPQ